MTLRLSIGLILLLVVAYGCGESEKDPGAEVPSIVDSTTFITQHPILDAKVRPGDSMLYDLTALIQEGIIVEADMPIIGMYVRQRGGVERTDSSVTAMTYRQLLNVALTQDMSGGIAACEGCNDSIVILIPGNSKRLYIGKGRKSLQTMIRQALQERKDVPSDYQGPPLNRPIDTVNWQETIRASMQKREDIDWILFGNAVILITHEGKDLSNYTYGRILAVVDEIREMDEFEDVQRLFERTKSQQ